MMTHMCTMLESKCLPNIGDLENTCMHHVQDIYREELTHDGGVSSVLDASHGVDAREDGADVVLVELDGVGVREEVVRSR